MNTVGCQKKEPFWQSPFIVLYPVTGGLSCSSSTCTLPNSRFLSIQWKFWVCSTVAIMSRSHFHPYAVYDKGGCSGRRMQPWTLFIAPFPLPFIANVHHHVVCVSSRNSGIRGIGLFCFYFAGSTVYFEQHMALCLHYDGAEEKSTANDFLGDDDY